ncbi:hypothetical protein IXB28_15120 [Leptothoe kymatousa TAU-MAC 1615]|uniref:Uncharacterized protein n=2 Tax=Leptothoe TaxID=2651725 RepID=A0ABS5Y839_9CYAN|nr:hypothetical protein [Leptothoe kymatousa TAU-MAC 1615]
MSQPTHRFVLFGTEFSGGRLVIDLLRRVADARHGPLPSNWKVESLLAHRHFFPLRHIQHHQLACPDYAFGFKLSAADLIATHQMSEPHRFMELLHKQGYKVIHLQRRDLMRHGIAVLKAQQPKVQTINPTELIATLKHLDEQRVAEAAMVAMVPHLTITYETDLLDPNVYKATAERLCHFLDLKQRQRAQYPVKLVHRSITDLMTNYDEVQAALKQSDYAYVLTGASAKLVM